MNFFTRITVVACLLAASLLPCTNAAAICQAGQTSACASCTSIGTCTTAGQPVIETEICSEDQVCSVTNGVASCGPPAGTICACDPFTVICDKYDPFKVMVCISQSSPPVNYVPILVQTCLPDMPCSMGTCGVPTSPPSSTTTPMITYRTTRWYPPTPTPTTTPTTTTSTTPTVKYRTTSWYPPTATPTTTPTTTTSTTPTVTYRTTSWSPPTPTPTTTPTTTTTTTPTTTYRTTLWYPPTPTPTTSTKHEDGLELQLVLLVKRIHCD